MIQNWFLLSCSQSSLEVDHPGSNHVSQCEPQSFSARDGFMDGFLHTNKVEFSIEIETEASFISFSFVRANKQK